MKILEATGKHGKAVEELPDILVEDSGKPAGKLSKAAEELADICDLE